MSDIEKLLNLYKEEVDKIEVPEDMEIRLRKALDGLPGKRRVRFLKRVAVFIVVLFLIGYNFDALAYYGRKFMGYENIMNGTLKELDELGEGQAINKSYEFKNGVKITLDGIMLDDNNLIAFYTIYAPEGNVDEVYMNLTMKLEGLFNHNYPYSGHGEISEDKTEMKWVTSFHSPRFYEKNMKLKFLLAGHMQEMGEIKFRLDRKKAMGRTLKLPIDTEVEVGQKRLEIKELLASPTSTVIRGQIQNIGQLVSDTIKGERFRPQSIGLSLLADGKEVQFLGSGLTSDMKGTYFETRHDALPKDTNRIDIKLTSLTGYVDIDEAFMIKKGKDNENISILDREITINNVYEAGGNTYVELSYDPDLFLGPIRLRIDGIEVGPKGVISSKYIEEGKNIKYTETIEFEGTGDILQLKINRVRLDIGYDDIIYSYEEK